MKINHRASDYIRLRLCDKILAMSEHIAIRPALAQDQVAVQAFCQNTFSWGDYIPKLWDAWLHDRRAELFVATLGSQRVGLMHIKLLDDGTAWVEGLRVHPGFRHRGIASALIAEGRSYAVRKNCAAIRLATGADNIASQNLFRGHEYVRIAQYGEWSAIPIYNKSLPFLVGFEHHLPQIVAQWGDFKLAHVVENPDWHWEIVDDAMLSKLIALGQIRVLPNGFAILRETHDSSLILHALVGEQDAMCKLALAARAEAGFRGMERADAVIVDDAGVNRALVDAGFRREGGMFVYEQAIQ
jgi:ribosomal protein S18 acetylase RimI-like enzyme